MSPLAQLTTTAPITSLAFLGDEFVLAGEASGVNILPLPLPATVNHTTAKKKRIFTRDRIHGILVSGDSGHVLFWGGRSLRMCSSASLLAEARVVADGKQVEAADWILTATFVDNNTVVAVGAHNALMVCRADSGWDGHSVPCGERTMLYAADVRVEEKEKEVEVEVAVGTVFGEILMWKWHVGDSTGTVVRRLRGHEGSVFGVRFEEGGRWLGSCSDDRTVRVWDLSVEIEDTAAAGPETTGFGGNLTVIGTACAAVGWGHQARPWTMRFIPGDDGDRDIGLVTIGEDLTARFWEFRPQTGKTVDLVPKAAHMSHSGKNVWSFCIDHARKLLATGGADGRVCLRDYGYTGEEVEVWDLQDVLDPLLTGENGYEGMDRTRKDRDMWKLYAPLDSAHFIATTKTGRVLLYTFPSTTNPSASPWTLLGQWEGLRNWGHAAAWDSSSLIALGLSDGRLLLLNAHRSDVSWIFPAHTEKVGGVYSCGRNGNKFYTLTQSTDVSEPLAFHCFEFVEEYDETPVHTRFTPDRTAAVVTAGYYDGRRGVLFVGNRNGWIEAYRPFGGGGDGDSVSASVRAGTDAITALHVEEDDVMVSTSRSGTYALHSLSLTSDTAALTTIHSAKPTPTIAAIEGLLPHQGQIFGFRGLYFVLHDLHSGLDVMSVNTSGQHRNWTFWGASSSARPYLLWTQATHLHIHRPPSRPPSHVLLQGLHGREIKALSYSPAARLLATGAEDTLLRFSSIDRDGTVRACGAAVKAHATGVLDVAWTQDGHRCVSAGGQEELFIWRVSAGGMLGVVQEAVWRVDGGSSGVKKVDIEDRARITSIDLWDDEGQDEGFLTALGLSDSTLHILHYNTCTHTLTTRSESPYNTRNCVCQVRFLDAKTLLVAATDGALSIFRAKPPGIDMQKLWAQPAVHENSIKVLTILAAPDVEGVTIATGGDDGAVAITSVAITGNQIQTVAFGARKRAHAAAVTGIVCGEGGIVSVSGDQKVRAWSVQRTGEAWVFGKMWERESVVADCGGAVAVDERRVVVAGVGVEVWEQGEVGVENGV